MMSMKMLLFLCLMAAGFLALAAVVGRLLFRQRFAFSRWMDRHSIRPSLVTGWVQVITGLVVFVSQFGLPISISVVQVLYVLFAATTIAWGVEKIFIPPSQEFRPPWFEGDGNPAWSTDRPSALARRISLLWIATVISVVAVGFAVFGGRMSNEKVAEQKHAEAVAQIQKLGGSVQQRSVNLAGTSITDNDIACLADLQKIRSLNLGATAITNDGLEHVAKMSGLGRLTLSGTDVSDEGLYLLRDLRQLHTLELRQTKVNGTGLNFRFGRDIIMLDLSLCPLTKEGIATVAQLRNINHISLSETDIDDSLVEEVLKIEAKTLDLRDTNLSKAALLRLEVETEMQILGR